MEKLKENHSAVPSTCKAVQGGKDFWETYVLSLEWKTVGVKDGTVVITGKMSLHRCEGERVRDWQLNEDAEHC